QPRQELSYPRWQFRFDDRGVWRKRGCCPRQRTAANSIPPMAVPVVSRSKYVWKFRRFGSVKSWLETLSGQNNPNAGQLLRHARTFPGDGNSYRFIRTEKARSFKNLHFERKKSARGSQRPDYAYRKIF